MGRKACFRGSPLLPVCSKPAGSFRLISDVKASAYSVQKRTPLAKNRRSRSPTSAPYLVGNGGESLVDNDLQLIPSETVTRLNGHALHDSGHKARQPFRLLPLNPSL